MKTVCICLWLSLTIVGCEARHCTNHPKGHAESHSVKKTEGIWHKELCINGYKYLVAGTTTTTRTLGITQIHNKDGPITCPREE